MRFTDLIDRQLSLFAEDYADLLDSCRAAERAYDRAGREEAEDRYAAYLELVEEVTDALVDIRTAYVSTLDPPEAAEYERAFDREVKRRLPAFAHGL